jgi:hypothetical protein
MKTQHFSFETAYHQFYLEDKVEKSDITLDFWSEEAFISKLAIHEGILGVGTYGYGNIKGEIVVLNEPSKLTDFSLYDHVVEGGIKIPSGKLQIFDCPNHNLQLSVKVISGNYRVRVYGSNFNSVEDYDLPNNTDNEFYTIEIWLGSNMDRKVLKQYIDE